MKGIASVGLLVSLLALAPAAEEKDARYGVHDPSIVRDGDSHYVFSTGRAIPVRVSEDLVTWRTAGSVFPEPPAWAVSEVPGAKDVWAPDVSFLGGRWHLYYSVSRPCCR